MEDPIKEAINAIMNLASTMGLSPNQTESIVYQFLQFRASGPIDWENGKNASNVYLRSEEMHGLLS